MVQSPVPASHLVGWFAVHSSKFVDFSRASDNGGAYYLSLASRTVLYLVRELI